MDRDKNLVAIPGHGLVHRVVDDLPHQVVKAGLTRGANVHARTHADGFETLEDLDLASAVVAFFCRHSVSPLY